MCHKFLMAAVSVLVESFEKVRGHHIYRAVCECGHQRWEKSCYLKYIEDANEHDKYAVSVVRGSDSSVAGHVLRRLVYCGSS